MKKNIVLSVVIVVCGLGGKNIIGSQVPQEHVCSAPVMQEASLDEFDQLVDEAATNNVFRGVPAIAAEPHGVKLFFMKCGVSLLTLYTSMVVKYRMCKAWFKAHCVDPITHRISITSENGHASEQTKKQ